MMGSKLDTLATLATIDTLEVVAYMMQIGPGLDTRATIRRWSRLSKADVSRLAHCTLATVDAWERSFDADLYGRGRNDAERVQVVDALADLYAAMMYIGGGCRWPEEGMLRDPALVAGAARMAERWAKRA